MSIRLKWETSSRSDHMYAQANFALPSPLHTVLVMTSKRYNTHCRHFATQASLFMPLRMKAFDNTVEMLPMFFYKT